MPSPAKPLRPMTATDWAMLLTLAALWGGSFFFNRIALQELPVLTVVWARVALAALLLLGLLHLRGEALPRGGAVWGALLVMGLLNNALPFALIVAGQQHIPSGVAAILNAATPLFTVLLAHILTQDERMSVAKFAGVLMGFIGVAVMIGFGALQQIGTALLAQMMCLGAALSYAFAGIWGRRFRPMGLTPLATATGQVIASSVMLLPLMLWFDRPWLLPMPSASSLGAVLGLAALCTALAYVLYFRLLATAGATNLLLVTFLVPVSAILLGSLFLDERLAPRHLAGIGLIELGLIAIDGRLWRKLR